MIPAALSASMAGIMAMASWRALVALASTALLRPLAAPRRQRCNLGIPSGFAPLSLAACRAAMVRSLILRRSHGTAHDMYPAGQGHSACKGARAAKWTIARDNAE